MQFDQEPELPVLAVICAAYNEASVIEKKIVSVFESTYPLHKIKFYIGTDACSDNTVALIKQMQKKYPSLHLIEFTSRSGKIAIINKLCSLADADIFIMTDANVFFREDTYFHLIKPFKDPGVKLVCGNIIKRALNKETVTLNELQYLSFENFLKHSESELWDLVIGAEGGCYALRKENYVPIPEHFIADDFYITCQVLQAKGKVLFENNALVYEDASADTAGEFRRKTRIATGNFQNLFYFSGLLRKPFTKTGFAFLSHKVLRWLSPFFFLINLLTCLALFFTQPVFGMLLLIELCVLVLPAVNYLLQKAGIKIGLFISVSHFVVMNIALFVGFIRYSRGVSSSVWQPVRK